MLQEPPSMTPNDLDESSPRTTSPLKVSKSPGLLFIIREDFKYNGSSLFTQGFWALLVYRLGYARKKVPIAFVRKIWGAFHFLFAKWIEVFCGIEININTQIGRRLTIEHSGGIILHPNAIIGDDVIIRQGVTLGNRRLSEPLAAPRIGSRVNIGAGAKLLGGIVIGNDVGIGANAVVLVDVPDRHLAIGVPATIRPMRNADSEFDASGELELLS
jgi:serine O-acetyltransferase